MSLSPTKKSKQWEFRPHQMCYWTLRLPLGHRPQVSTSPHLCQASRWCDVSHRCVATQRVGVRSHHRTDTEPPVVIGCWCPSTWWFPWKNSLAWLQICIVRVLPSRVYGILSAAKPVLSPFSSKFSGWQVAGSCWIMSHSKEALANIRRGEDK